MHISAADGSIPSPKVPPGGSASAPRANLPTEPSTTANLRVAGLLSMLANKPEVRPEVVARGRALAADPTYPPHEVIEKLASLLVR